jgi:hypothetical protein
MDTSRVDGVKAPLHNGTPRSLHRKGCRRRRAAAPQARSPPTPSSRSREPALESTTAARPASAWTGPHRVFAAAPPVRSFFNTWGPRREHPPPRGSEAVRGTRRGCPRVPRRASRVDRASTWCFAARGRLPPSSTAPETQRAYARAASGLGGGSGPILDSAKAAQRPDLRCKARTFWRLQQR